MTYPWQPMEPSDAGGGEPPEPPADLAAWSELFATTIAHLAAQLTTPDLAAVVAPCHLVLGEVRTFDRGVLARVDRV